MMQLIYSDGLSKGKDKVTLQIAFAMIIYEIASGINNVGRLSHL